MSLPLKANYLLHQALGNYMVCCQCFCVRAIGVRVGWRFGKDF